MPFTLLLNRVNLLIFHFWQKFLWYKNQRNSFFRDWSLKWTYSSWAQVGGDCGLPTYALCGTPPSLKSLNTCIWSRAGTPRQVSSASSSSSCSCARASQIITDCLSGFWQTELLRSHNLCLVCLSMMLPVQIHTLPSRQNRHHRQILVLVWCPSLVRPWSFSSQLQAITRQRGQGQSSSWTCWPSFSSSLPMSSA